jgi:hypothetical protein
MGFFSMAGSQTKAREESAGLKAPDALGIASGFWIPPPGVPVETWFSYFRPPAAWAGTVSSFVVLRATTFMPDSAASTAWQVVL